jgi:hypothetical protein
MTAKAEVASKNLNISVLSASMAEHQQQIHRNLTSAVQKFFRATFSEAQQASLKPHPETKKKTPELQLFREKLKTIEKWNQKTVDSIVNWIMGKFHNPRFNLAKVLKALIIGRTMLLVSVARPDESAPVGNIKIDVPDVNNYIHNVLCLVAHRLLLYPSLMTVDKKDTESDLDSKATKVRKLIDAAIDNAILDILPSDSVNQYLDGAMEAKQFEPRDAELATYGFDHEDVATLQQSQAEVKKEAVDTVKHVQVPAPPADMGGPIEGEKKRDPLDSLAVSSSNSPRKGRRKVRRYVYEDEEDDDDLDEDDDGSASGESDGEIVDDEEEEIVEVRRRRPHRKEVARSLPPAKPVSSSSKKPAAT